jgi:hypothetical protein
LFSDIVLRVGAVVQSSTHNVYAASGSGIAIVTPSNAAVSRRYGRRDRVEKGDNVGHCLIKMLVQEEVARIWV